MIDRTGLGEVTQHLADEERVPGRLGEERIAQRQAFVVHPVPGRPFQPRQEVGVAQATQRQSVDAVLTMQHGEQA